MKIAVLLYGHLRDFEQCADSLNENLLSHYDCDVFIHTWDVTDHSSTTWHSQRFMPRPVDEKIVNNVKSLYNTKGLIVEHQEPYEYAQIIETNECRNWTFSTELCYYVFYSMNKANGLRKKYEADNNIKYDYIVVTRPDVELKKQIDIEKIIIQANVIGLDLNVCRFFATHRTDSSSPNAFVVNSPNDILFFGISDVVDRYISANINLTKEYIEKHSPNVVSVYTSKEIEAGLNPVPLSYLLGKDWSFSGFRVVQSIDYFPWNPIKKFLGRVVVILLKPVFKMYQTRPWINFYNK